MVILHAQTTPRGVAVREPSKLCSIDRNDSVSCIVANLLYMVGIRKSEPDAKFVQWVDTQLGRRPGEPVRAGAEMEFLLGMGLHVHRITNFDLRRFVNEGLPYLKESYGERWNTYRERYWTPARVHHVRESDARYLDRLSHYASQITHDPRKPTIGDLRYQVVELKRAVDLTIQWDKNAPTNIHEAGLVFKFAKDQGNEREYMTIYMPHFRHNTHIPALPDIFEREAWNAYAGVNVYWLP